MSGIVGGNLGRGSGLIKAGAIDDNSVTLAKMAGLARGNLIYGDTSGDPAALAVGSANEVLTHDGTDFDWAAAAGGGDLSFGGDTFGADKTIGANDAYALSLETSGNVAMKIDALGHITKPLQSAFSVLNHGGDTINNNNESTITWDSEIFDVNADFTSSTFTAPVTGKYFLQACVFLDFGSTPETLLKDGYLRILASNRSAFFGNKAQYTNQHDRVAWWGSCLMDMDASDTVYTQIWFYRDSGVDTATTIGSDYLMYFNFSGMLVG